MATIPPKYAQQYPGDWDDPSHWSYDSKKDINKMETFLKKGYKNEAMILLQKKTGVKLHSR